MTLRVASAVTLGLVAWLGSASIAQAQSCSGTGFHFWKNDTLPAVPSGSIGVAVIPGLCPGEAAASVYTLPPNTPTQKIAKLGIGLGNQNGQNGFNCLVNIEIYDGIAWSPSNIPTLGPKVFDYATATGGNLQITTHGINEIDFSTLNAVVGNGTGAFVVAVRMMQNTNGTCAAGYGKCDFITDTTSIIIGQCSAKTHANLMDLQGIGWRDPKFTSISGLPLCPIYYNGNWIIRACTQDNGPVTVCQAEIGFGGPGTSHLKVCGQPLSSGNFATLTLENAPPSHQVVLFGSTGFNPTFTPVIGGTIAPIPAQIVLSLGTDPTGSMVIPGVPGGGGPFSFHVQCVTADPSLPKGWNVSNTVQMTFLP